jgi:hypothetical protein
VAAPAHLPIPAPSRPEAEPSTAPHLSAEGTHAEAPLTSEPPLPDAELLTSEPPLADRTPLTSEPCSLGPASAGRWG